jgi:hypothetical protein
METKIIKPKTIIPSVDRLMLVREISKLKLVRITSRGNNMIFIFDGSQYHSLMKEVGRLREITFRDAGGGTGKSMDIDEYDLGICPNTGDRVGQFRQLIVWDPIEKEIIGGYRFIKMSDLTLDQDQKSISPTLELFEFSSRFQNKILPYTIELGRSFVQPKYQPRTDSRKGMFSLDNLWDGLGALAISMPEIRYFFGKFTMYDSYSQQARNLIMFFLRKYFPDNDGLMYPKYPIYGIENEIKLLKDIFIKNSPEEDMRVLMEHVKLFGETVPPLVKQYMDLSPTMKHFGTSINDHFGHVEETGILVTIGDIYDNKKSRYMKSYIPN